MAKKKITKESNLKDLKTVEAVQEYVNILNDEWRNAAEGTDKDYWGYKLAKATLRLNGIKAEVERKK